MHFIPLVQSHVVNGFAGFAELCQNMVLLLGHSSICCEYVGLLLSRLSLCKLLYIFLFLLFSLSVTVYCANFRLIVVSDFALAEYSVNGPLDVQANGSRQHVSNHMDLC